jgi:hypothetical protein
VEQTVHVVAPADDRFTVAPAARVPGGADLDVAANDPAGLSLHAVMPAGHGTVQVVGDRVHYTPRSRFGGRDSFSYEVADAAGRTATATVSVRVPDLAPQLEGARTAQVAGTERRVELAPTDPNGDDVTLTAGTVEPGVEVSVEGHTVVVRPRRNVSGRVEITVVATDPDGASARAVVVDRVSPEAVDHAARTLRERGGTRVAWDAAPTRGARYEVRVAGKHLCTTDGLSCDSSRLLGPRTDVDVRVLGRDGTVSDRRDARPEGARGVLVTTVYFDPDQSVIRRDQRAKLHRGVARVHASGFGTAELRGYTDSDGSWASGIRLSKRRTATVARWLAQVGIGSSQAWFGEGDPAAANTTAAGKARNRRVELWVSYS